MMPEAYCDHLAQKREMGAKKRVKFVPSIGWFRVYWLRPRREVGPFPTIERACLADQNFFRADENYTKRRASYEAP
jgi:hypothetical protein